MMMQLPTRLEGAISRLYKAYYQTELNPECPKNCAVGNICNNTDTWEHLTVAHGSLKLSYVGLVNENFGKRIFGYSPMELLQIEVVFLKGCGYQVPVNRNLKRPSKPANQDVLFDALCDTVEFLCKLDHVSNVMDNSMLINGNFLNYERPPVIDKSTMISNIQ